MDAAFKKIGHPADDLPVDDLPVIDTMSARRCFNHGSRARRHRKSIDVSKLKCAQGHDAGDYRECTAVRLIYRRRITSEVLMRRPTPAKVLKIMAGPCGLDPQTSTVPNPNPVRDGATPKKSERREEAVFSPWLRSKMRRGMEMLAPRLLKSNGLLNDGFREYQLAMTGSTRPPGSDRSTELGRAASTVCFLLSSSSSRQTYRRNNLSASSCW
jgi:hypothetical protein